MAQNETLEQKIKLFYARLDELEEGGSESIDLGEASKWLNGIQDAFNAERGRTGTGSRDVRLMEEEERDERS